MSVQEIAGVVAAVAIAIVAARDVQPADADGNAWLREPLPVSEPLPPGHPPVPGSLMPRGHPPIETQPRLPEGHPPIPWANPGCPNQRGGMPDESLGLGLRRDERKIISI